MFGQLATSRAFQIVFMLFIGIFILVLRNPDPILNSVVYTEDGQWVGRALSNGWLNTFINAKDGYFVWGNLALLWASVTTSEAICNDPLVCLPQGIAFYSYFTFSSLALLVFISTRNIISTTLRTILFILVLIIPMGDSANEIIGRLSNVGYVAVLAATLLFYYKGFLDSKLLHVSIDIFLVLLAGTNPVVIPVTGLFVFYNMLITSEK